LEIQDGAFPTIEDQGLEIRHLEEENRSSFRKENTTYLILLRLMGQSQQHTIALDG
jgi:hypothetical protein